MSPDIIFRKYGKSLDCSILFANKNKNFKDKKDMPVVKLKFLMIKVLI